MFLYFLLSGCHSFEFSKSIDLKILTVKGLSNEIFQQSDYRGSGTYTKYEKVILEYGITKLGDSVFSQSTNLKFVDFPITLTDIGQSLFYQDTNLVSIVLPEGLKSIPFGTFRETGIQNLSIPSTVTSISGGSTFSNTLKRFIFPNGNPIYSTSTDGSILIYKDIYLRELCGGCQTITVPPNIKIICSMVSGWRGTNNIIFSQGSQLTTVQSSAFNYCNITSITFPYGLERIEGPCFAGSNVTSITLPSTLVYLPDNMFSQALKMMTVFAEHNSAVVIDSKGVITNKKNTEVIYIPDTLTKFHISWNIKTFAAVFMKLHPTFQNISVDQNHTIYYAEDNLLYKKSGNDLVFIAPAGNKSDVQIHENCTSIEGFAFTGSFVQYISFLGNKITYLSDSCCHNADRLKEVVLADSILTVGTDAFWDSNVTKVTFNHGLTTINRGAFCRSQIEEVDLSHCAKLKTVNIICFSACKYLKRVKLPPSLSYIVDSMFSSSKELDTIEIDVSKITRIEINAFLDCKLTNLSFISAENKFSLKTIGIKAFSGCKVRSIEVPCSVSSIADEAFANCENLQNLVFRENSELTALSGRLIAGSNRVRSLFIGPKVEVIKEGALTEAFGLTDIIVSENNAEFKSSEGIITSYNGEYIWACAGGRTRASVGPDVSSIKSSAFLNCKKLKEIIFDQSGKLSEIGPSTFFGCSSIELLKFPEKLEVIGPNSFNGCKQLHCIEFAPGSVLRSIGDSAFADCPLIEAVVVPLAVEKIGNNAFGSCNHLKDVSICIEKNREEFSDYAFSGCDNLQAISVSIFFNDSKVLGKPAQGILDKNCQIPTFFFTEFTRCENVVLALLSNLLNAMSS